MHWIFFTLLQFLKLCLDSFLSLHRHFKVSWSSLKFSCFYFLKYMKHKYLNYFLIQLIYDISASILLLVFNSWYVFPLWVSWVLSVYKSLKLKLRFTSVDSTLVSVAWGSPLPTKLYKIEEQICMKTKLWLWILKGYRFPLTQYQWHKEVYLLSLLLWVYCRCNPLGTQLYRAISYHILYFKHTQGFLLCLEYPEQPSK